MKNSMILVAAVAATFAFAGGPAKAGLSFNAITSNAITANALTNNSLTNNALTNNAITNNAISTNSLSSNGLAPVGAVDQLNGVTVEAVSVPVR